MDEDFLTKVKEFMSKFTLDKNQRLVRLDRIHKEEPIVQLHVEKQSKKPLHVPRILVVKKISGKLLSSQK
jgi:hypothetical protein